jgi:hypothetical protein
MKLKKAKSSKVAKAVREALDVGPNEDVDVQVRGPEFQRRKSAPAVAAPPASRSEWEALSGESRTALRERGLLMWSEFKRERERWVDTSDIGEDGTHVLMLFPGEWAHAIPDRLGVVTISGASKPFDRARMGKDVRLGCLAVGLMVKR